MYIITWEGDNGEVYLEYFLHILIYYDALKDEVGTIKMI